MNFSEDHRILKCVIYDSMKDIGTNINFYSIQCESLTSTVGPESDKIFVPYSFFRLSPNEKI